MFKRYSSALALGFLALAIVPAAAEPMLAVQQVFTLKGKATHVGEFFSIFPDCTLDGVDDFRVVMAPRHGKISKVRGKATVHFTAPNPAARCKGRQVPSTNAVYTPTPGYVGNDALELEVLIHTGKKVLMPVNIGVGHVPPGYK